MPSILSYQSRRKSILFAILISIIILIFFIILSIIFIDKNNLNINKADQKNIDFKELTNKIDSLSKNQEIASVNYYYRAQQKLKEYSDPSLPSDKKYKILAQANIFLFSLYSDTNYPELNNIINDLKKYAKNTFPDLYNESDFPSACIDPTCAEEPQPKEILDIVAEIDKTTLPNEEKKILMNDILNVGFLPSKNVETRGNAYLIMAQFTSEYFNSKEYNYPQISVKFYSFIEKNYPDQYRDYQESLKNQKNPYEKYINQDKATQNAK